MTNRTIRRRNRQITEGSISTGGDLASMNWRDLSALDEAEVDQLAQAYGIPFSNRMETLSALNKLRKTL